MRQVILRIPKPKLSFLWPLQKNCRTGQTKCCDAVESENKSTQRSHTLLLHARYHFVADQLVAIFTITEKRNNYLNVIVVSLPSPPEQGDDVKLHFVSILMLGDFPLFTKRLGIVSLLFSSEVKLPWNILLLSERGHALNSLPFMKRIQMMDLCSSSFNSLTLFCH